MAKKSDVNITKFKYMVSKPEEMFIHNIIHSKRTLRGVIDKVSASH